MSENGNACIIEENLPILPRFTKDLGNALESCANGSNGTHTCDEDNDEKNILDGGSVGTVHPQPNLNSLPGGVKVITGKDAKDYKMDYLKQGHCLIFNHENFERHLGMNQRNGTNADRDGLKHLFSSLGFDVHCHDNLTVKNIQNVLHKYAYDVDHSLCSTFVVFFLSHGEHGQLYGRDNIFDVNKLFKSFTADNCTTLAGKPKMFFIQACRGERVESSVRLAGAVDKTDNAGFQSYAIPSHADFLTCYSTVEDFYSWRNTVNGAWFIQSLIEVFKKSADHEDVLSMMTEVNRYMILNFVSNCPSNYDMHDKKQTASICSTLMRKVYLRPII